MSREGGVLACSSDAEAFAAKMLDFLGGANEGEDERRATVLTVELVAELRSSLLSGTDEVAAGATAAADESAAAAQASSPAAAASAASAAGADAERSGDALEAVQESGPREAELG
eukprot:TRINITY_DN16840_c0_g2_i1.p2 TRINITY_DN16840_c0_g2~~TRINITY_DN16840_c0_g2_i1.p2  ORF type:complete len:115 (-),score=43.19 TRINITY_DN16840_c0_g2_i1:4-348(-)